MSKNHLPQHKQLGELDEEEGFVSKTALKREMLALQELGKSLVNLSKGELDCIPIADVALAEAISTARKIKHREGLRRQMQYIGKLMRKIDISEMEKAYAQLQAGRKEKTHEFHQLEQWRDQLIDRGHSAVEDVMLKFPQADRQHLRQLISRANKEKTLGKPPTCARKLFRYLKDLSDKQGS